MPSADQTYETERANVQLPMVLLPVAGGPGGVLGHHPRAIVETMWISPLTLVASAEYGPPKVLMFGSPCGHRRRRGDAC